MTHDNHVHKNLAIQKTKNRLVLIFCQQEEKLGEIDVKVYN